MIHPFAANGSGNDLIMICFPIRSKILIRIFQFRTRLDQAKHLFFTLFYFNDSII